MLDLPRVRFCSNGNELGCDPMWPYVNDDGSAAATTAYVWRHVRTRHPVPVSESPSLGRHAATLARLKLLGVVDIEEECRSDLAAATNVLEQAWRAALPSGHFDLVFAPQAPTKPTLDVLLPQLSLPFGGVRLVPDVDDGRARGVGEVPPLIVQLGGCVVPVCPPSRVFARSYVQRAVNPLHHLAHGLLEAADFFLNYGKKVCGHSSRDDNGASSLVDEIELRLCGAVDFSSRVDCAVAAEPSVLDHSSASGRGALLEAARIAYFLVQQLASGSGGGAKSSISDTECRGLIVRVSTLRDLLADITPHGGRLAKVAGSANSAQPHRRVLSSSIAHEDVHVPAEAAGVSVYVLLDAYDVLTHSLEALRARALCVKMCGVALRGVGAITPGLAFGNPMGKAIMDRRNRVMRNKRAADIDCNAARVYQEASDSMHAAATQRRSIRQPNNITPERSLGTASGSASVCQLTLRCLRWPKPATGESIASERRSTAGRAPPALPPNHGVLRVSVARMHWAELFPNMAASTNIEGPAEAMDLRAAVCCLADGDGFVASDTGNLVLPGPPLAMEVVRLRMLTSTVLNVTSDNAAKCSEAAEVVPTVDEGVVDVLGSPDHESSSIAVVGVTPRIYFTGLQGEPVSVETLVMQALTVAVDPRTLLQHRSRLLANATGAVACGRGYGRLRSTSIPFPPAFGGTNDRRKEWVTCVRHRAFSGGARLVGDPATVLALLGHADNLSLQAALRDELGNCVTPDGGTLVVDERHPDHARLVFNADVTHVVEPARGFMTPRLRAAQLGAVAPSSCVPLCRGTGWRCVFSENILWDALLSILLRPVIMATPTSMRYAAEDTTPITEGVRTGDGRTLMNRSGSAESHTVEHDADGSVHVPPSLVSRVQLSPADAACIAANLAWVWKHPWQTGPLDFPSADFIPMRQALYDAWMCKLHAMTPCQLAAHAATVMDAMTGETDAIRARLHIFRRDDICELLHAAGPAAVLHIIDRLARDHASYAAGLPDITTWQPVPCPHCPFGVAGNGGCDDNNDHAMSLYQVDIDPATTMLAVAPQQRPVGEVGLSEPFALSHRRGRWLFSKRAYDCITAAAEAKLTRPNSDLLLVEVKSSSDTVRRHQLEWMMALEHVAHVAVVTVEAES